MLIGLLVAIPLVVLPFYKEEIKYAIAFIIPSVISFIIGIIICVFSKQDNTNDNWKQLRQRGSLTVLFAWCYGFIIGAIPFLISEKLTIVQALFEAVSGWTTTGLSVIDVSSTPRVFLFHRSFMQFCGGLGFVMVMIMFVHGKQAMNLYNAEGHPDRLRPNLRKTVWTIFMIYITSLIIGTLLYILLGMDAFDSLLHAMSALSTGGFSTHIYSIGVYDNIPIEVLTIVLMLIGTTNFAVLLLVVRRKFKQAVRVSEIKFLMVLLIIFITLAAVSLTGVIYSNIGKSIRIAIFNIVSALSTTGYSTVDYKDWPPFAIGLLILLMLIGGGIGSTAGGIKLSRVYVIMRTMFSNIRKRLSPENRVDTLYYYKAQGKTRIDQSFINDVMGFTICYISIFVIGSLLLTVTEGCSLTEAMFEFASTIGTVGLSIGLTGPSTGTATLIIQMFGMILGRLEIFIVFTGVYSSISAIKVYIRNHIF